MSGIINKQKLEYLENIEVEAQKLYSQAPDADPGNLENVPKVAIWHREPGSDFEFLSAQDPKFAIIQNRDIFRAMDEVAFDKGVKLEVDYAGYHRGRTMVNFIIPDAEFNVPGDSSAIKPGILTGNHYGGGGSVQHLPSSVRGVCSNGMILKTDLAAATKRKHFGIIDYKDIYEMTALALNNLEDAVALMKLTAEVSARTMVSDEQVIALLEQIEKGVAKKYHETLTSVIDANLQELGHNAWGMVQGVSELYQHHLKGDSFNGGKLRWRDNSIEKVLREAGVSREVKVLINR